METLTSILNSVAALITALGALIAGIAALYPLIKKKNENTVASSRPVQKPKRIRWPAVIGTFLVLVSGAIFAGRWLLQSPLEEIPPCSLGLVCELFPQGDDGELFAFQNHGGVFSTTVPDQTCSHSGPYGLRLKYDMTVGADDANGGWGVHWNTAIVKHFNTAQFRTLGFWVKGAAGGEMFQIGLKDTTGKEANLESKQFAVVTNTWTLVTIPLRKYRGEGVNTDSIENMHFGFNRDHGKGTICIDEITFVP